MKMHFQIGKCFKNIATPKASSSKFDPKTNLSDNQQVCESIVANDRNIKYVLIHQLLLFGLCNCLKVKKCKKVKKNKNVLFKRP